MSLRQYRAHPRLRLIDELIERCTKHNPADRPAMQDVANDLRAWLRLASEASAVPDLSEYGKRLRRIGEPRLSDEQRRARLEEICGELSDRLAARLRATEQVLRSEYRLTKADVRDQFTENMLGFVEHLGSATLIAQDARATRVEGGDALEPLVLTFGRCVSVTDDGQVHVSGLLSLGLEGVSGGQYEELETERVPADSIQAGEAIEQVARGLESRVEEWLGRFVSMLAGDDR